MEKQSITKEQIVAGVVDKIMSEIGKKKVDMKMFWTDAWDQIVDEAHYYGIFVKDNTTPGFPEQLEGIDDKTGEVKKLLLQVLKDRTK